MGFRNSISIVCIHQEVPDATSKTWDTKLGSNRKGSEFHISTISLKKTKLKSVSVGIILLLPYTTSPQVTDGKITLKSKSVIAVVGKKYNDQTRFNFCIKTLINSFT